MKKTRLTTFSLLLCIVLLLPGCQKKPARADLAHTFVEKVFTIPSPALAELAGSGLEPDSSAYREKLLSAMNDLCSGMADKEKLFNLEGSFFQHIVALHLINGGKGSSYIVEQVAVREATAGQFSYTVQLKPSNGAGIQEIIGNLRFNGDDLVEQMSIQSMKEKE